MCGAQQGTPVPLPEVGPWRGPGPASPAGCSQVHRGNVERGVSPEQPPGLQGPNAYRRPCPSPGSGVDGWRQACCCLSGLKDWGGLDFTLEGPCPDGHCGVTPAGLVGPGPAGDREAVAALGLEPEEPFYSHWAETACGGPQRPQVCPPALGVSRSCEASGGLTLRAAAASGEGCPSSHRQVLPHLPGSWPGPPGPAPELPGPVGGAGLFLTSARLASLFSTCKLKLKSKLLSQRLAE